VKLFFGLLLLSSGFVAACGRGNIESDVRPTQEPRRVSQRADAGFMMYGTTRLVQDLIDLGYRAEEVAAADGQRFAVIAPFTVPGGRFDGRTIDLGLQGTPDFPMTVASAIHVRANPQLYDYGDTLKDVRNIIVSPLGPEWRYWSHNFQWQGERNARRLLSQINGIFFNAS
jgi:hypothetical protein